MTALLRCEQLTQVYRVGANEVLALQGLELDVAPGEMVGIIGASGSGKSTLLHVLSGLLRPTGGRAIFDGLDLGAATGRVLDAYRRNDVGFVWQSGERNLVAHLTAKQNVVVAAELAGHREASKKADELLETVGVAERAQHRQAELSGGEQQRVALAVALVNDPKLLLADEPTGALDADGTAAMFSLIGDVRDRYGLTVVMVSHDPAVAQSVDRILTIRDGRVSSEGRWSGTDEGEIRETLVIDSIGRLQLTEEQRSALGGADRVVAEVEGDHLTIRGVGDTDD